MTANNILVCKSGTNELQQNLPGNSAITELVLKGKCLDREITTLASIERSQFLTALTLDSTEEETVLSGRACQKIASLHFLESLTLINVAIEPKSLTSFSRLTHLALGRLSDQQIAAINQLKKLKSLHLGGALTEQRIRWLCGLKNLTILEVDFQCEKETAAWTVANNLPQVRFVRQLPEMPFMTEEMLQIFFKTLEHRPNFLLKRIFCLQDENKHDLFHYCREVARAAPEVQLEPLVRYVSLDTATEEQLLEWLQFAIESPNRFIFERILATEVDINKPFANGKFALLEALKKHLNSQDSTYQNFVTRLLERGARADLPDAEGHFALALATRAYKSSLVHKMLKTVLNVDLEVVSASLQEKARGSPFSTLTAFRPLQIALMLWFKNYGQDSIKCTHALKMVEDILDKKPDVTKTYLHLIMKCDLPFPVDLVTQLLKQGASSTLKDSEGHTPLNLLLRAIQDLDTKKSNDKKLWEAKFGYLKAIIENGDTRIKSYAQLLDIAKYYGIHSVIPFLSQKAKG